MVRPKKGKDITLKRTGWGYFSIPITVYFKEETGILEPLELDHMLNFEGGGVSLPCKVEIVRDKLLSITE